MIRGRQMRRTRRTNAKTTIARFPAWLGLLLLFCAGALWPAAALGASLTATIQVAKDRIGIGQNSDVTITFSEAIIGFSLANMTTDNGTLSNLATSDNQTWTTRLTPVAGITFANNKIALDFSGITGSPSGDTGTGTVFSNNYAIDAQRPMATIVMANPTVVAGGTSLVTITFSEAVTGFDNAVLSVPNGTLSAVSSSDGGVTWTATFTPAANVRDTTNVISLNMSGVADLAGNTGTGIANSSNFTIDTVRPTATIVVANPFISLAPGYSDVTITFSEAVSGFSNAGLTVPSGSLSTVASSDGGITWTATFTPTANTTQSSNVITLDMTGVQNVAGNTGSGTASSNNYRVDTVLPTATVVVANPALVTNGASLVTITFSEPVTGVSNANLSISNGTLSALSSGDGGVTWTATFTAGAGSSANNVIMLDMTGVKDAAGNSSTGTVTSNNYTINAPAMTLPASLPDGASGRAYSRTLAVTGGTAPYTFSIVTGSLPTGLKLDARTGDVTGTPSSVGSFSFTVEAKDANHFTVSQAYTVNVVAPTIGIDPSSIAGGMVGTAYSQTFTFSGGTAPYGNYAATGLPAGLSITASTANSMTVSGTPGVAGSFNITIGGTDSTAGGTYQANKTYTLTVSLPTPVAVSRHISVEAGKQIVVDLTEGATNGPFVSAALISALPASAGPASISGTQLTFAPEITFEGEATVVFTLSNAFATSAQTAIYFDVKGRPDPSRDAEVIGLLTAQADSARRFADSQTQNFNSRLEQLHDEGDRRRNSVAVRLGYSGNDRKDEAEQRFEDLLGQDPAQAGGVPGFAMHNYASDDRKGEQPAVDADLGKLAVWTGGFVNFGKRDDGKLSLDYTTAGVSGGFDYRFSKSLVAGFGFGYGRDATDIGSNGTESRAHAYSGAVYASYSPLKATFIDALIGGSWLDFSSVRYETPTGNFATGDRTGSQIFGSVTASYEKRDDSWLVSPYGRLDFSRSWLASYTESGSDAYILKYGSQTVDTLSGVAGLRLEYAIPTDWGIVKPGARVEYTHDFAGSSQVSLDYADMDVLRYGYQTDSGGSDYVTLGASLDASLNSNWTARFDYRTAVGGVGQSHAFGLKAGKNF